MLWTFITSRWIYNLWTGSSWARWQDPNCFEQSWHGGPSGVQYPVWLCTMWNVICTLYNIHILYKCEMTIMQMITTIQISGTNEGLWCSDVELGQGTLKMVTVFPEINTLSNTYLVPPGAWHTRGGQGLHWQLLGSAVKVGKALCDWEWWQNSQIWCEPAAFWSRGAGPLCRSPVTSQVGLKHLVKIKAPLWHFKGSELWTHFKDTLSGMQHWENWTTLSRERG